MQIRNYYAVLLILSIALAERSNAQVVQPAELPVSLTGIVIKSLTVAPGNPVSATITIDPSLTGGDSIETISTDAAVTIALIEPGGQTVNAGNASSLGFDWTTSTVAASDQGPGFGISTLPGIHTVIGFPIGAPPGAYQIQATAGALIAPATLAVIFRSSSDVKAALTAGGSAYRTGDKVVLSGGLLDGAAPIVGATVSASLTIATDVSAQASITGSTIATSTPAPPNQVIEEYTLTLTNSGPALSTVTAEIRSVDLPVSVLAGSVFFVNVPAKGTAVSQNTLRIQRDPATPFNPVSLKWSIRSKANVGLPIPLNDSGPDDAATGDGIYTGSFIAAQAGTYAATMTATGTTSAGLAFERQASTTFDAFAPAASFGAFSDAAIDDNGNGLSDRIQLTAAVTVKRAGKYSLFGTLQASNGNQISAQTTATLAAGTQQIALDFPADQIIGTLGVNGPYSRVQFSLLSVSQFEEETPADAKADAGPTAPYDLASFDRGALYYKDPITATGVTTTPGDGFDLLRVEGGIHTQTSQCSWNGTLNAADGSMIDRAGGFQDFGVAGDQRIRFDFNGPRIARSGKDGPYSVVEVIVACGGDRADAHQYFQTPAFTVSQFKNTPGDFTLTADQGSISITAGTTGTISLTLTPSSGFNSNVTLTTTGAPTGVKITLNPPLLTGEGLSTMSIDTEGNAPAGVYPITITYASGAITKTLPIDLLITRIAVSVVPTSVELWNGESQQFFGFVTGTVMQDVTYSLSPAIGTLSAGGVYTAPARIATRQAIKVVATSVEDGRTKGSGALVLQPVTVLVSPARTVVYASESAQFAAAVSGSVNPAVNWSVSPALGTISPSGTYTAPGAVASEQPVTITATSAADSLTVGAATVLLSPQAPFTIAPRNALLRRGEGQKYVSTNPSVTWSINPPVGSISTVGRYTVPSAIMVAQSVDIVATSMADPSKSAKASANLLPLAAVNASPSGTTVYSGATVQFRATVLNSVDPSVTWSMSPVFGTLSPTGLYAPPATHGSPQTLKVTATSVAYPTRSSTVTLVVVP